MIERLEQCIADTQSTVFQSVQLDHLKAIVIWGSEVHDMLQNCREERR